MLKSIQNRLLILLLVFIILPYFLSVLLIYRQTKENVERHELENSREQMQQASYDIAKYFDDIVNLPYLLYRNPDFFRFFKQGFEDSPYLNLQEINKDMVNFYLMRSEFRQIRFYTHEEGISFSVYNAMLSSGKRDSELLKQASIQKLMDSEMNYVIEPPHPIVNYNNTSILPESDQSVVLTIHHKIMDTLTNEFLGIITIDMDLDQIASLANHVLAKNETVLLSDAEGHVIYTSDKTWTDKTIPAELADIIYSSSAGATVSDGDIVFSNSLQVPIKDWHFTKITSSQLLFESVRSTAYTNIIVGVIVGGLGMIMVAVISYYVTRPIKLLSQKVQSIEAGNMNAPFNDKREDEIGILERNIKDMMNRINRHIDREYKLEIENRKNQHRALKSQVNPHFLFNTLQSIATVALLSDSPKVYQLINSLSKMMRYSIRVDQKATIRSEVEYVKAYLHLQEERFQNDFSYSLEIPEEIFNVPVPSMILQPLVENFFKHCYDKGYEQACLHICGEIQGENIHLVVENTGSSMTAEELELLQNNIYTAANEENYSLKHIGLKNIHDRLVLHFDQSAGITVDNLQGEGFSVRLVIPLKYEGGVRHEGSYRR